MDMVIHDRQLIRIDRLIGVGDIAMEHIEQAAILRDHDAVAVGMARGGDHADTRRNDLAPGKVIIRAVREIHRRNTRIKAPFLIVRKRG